MISTQEIQLEVKNNAGTDCVVDTTHSIHDANELLINREKEQESFAGKNRLIRCPRNC